uniref:Uncharacterized protein n=1 Tax=Monodon monoceros TaxID=40151 RepID=A0A8C6BRT0_MONMO
MHFLLIFAWLVPSISLALSSDAISPEQKLGICRHICGWSYSTTCTLCGLPQCVEKYSKCFIVWGVVTISCNLDGLFFLGNIL